MELILKKSGIAEGETPISYREVVRIFNALRELSARHLPTKEARIAFGRRVRAFQPLADEYTDERNRIQQAHVPKVDTLEEGEEVKVRDPIGMGVELNDLERLVVGIKMPSPIKAEWLPVKDKEHPKNEDGLASLLADLGPLYDMGEDEAAAE